MDVSGLNKQLHLIYSQKLASHDYLSTSQEIIDNVAIILKKLVEFDSDQLMHFEIINDLLHPLSTSTWEIYVSLMGLAEITEAVDSTKQGYSSLELIERNPRLVFDDNLWADFLDNNNFIRPLAVQHRLKKLCESVVQDSHSQQQLEHVSFTQDDLNSRKCRFHLHTKNNGIILIYVVPCIEINTRPKCIQTDLLSHHKTLLTCEITSRLQWDPSFNVLWYISSITMINHVFYYTDKTGGIQRVVRELVYFLCDKYVHYPVSRRIIDCLMIWLISGYRNHEEWRQEKLAIRVLELLENLRRSLRNYRVRDYFIPFKNILDDIEFVKLDNAAERVSTLITKLKNQPSSLKIFDHK